MTDPSPIQTVSPALLAIAAQEPTWQRALRLLALAATDANVEAFRVKASELGLDVSHLRWRRKWADISTAELSQAVDGSRDYLTILEQLGYRPGGSTYRRLESLCAEHGVELPALRPRVRATFYGGVSDDEIRSAFSQSRSIADLLRRVGLVPKGDNYRVMRQRLYALGLDPKQLSGQRWAAGQQLAKRSLEELLRPGVRCSGPDLVRRLIEAGLMTRECACCRLTEWLGEPIPLELDHINGEHDDNRLENLRLLCPTCHAMTPTYRGRNVRARRARRLGDAAPEC